jgi:uncharacterized membrane protein YjgN (DUF898 family)
MNMNRLVDRFGRTGFALLASLIWAVPMAAWAGSADLSPIDQTAYPKVALAIGVVMLAVWLVLVSRLARVKVTTERPHRFDLTQMSTSEKRWTIAAAAFGTGLIGELNAAATVDWTPLTEAVKQGKLGPILLAAALAAFFIAMVAGIAYSWRTATAAYNARKARTARNGRPTYIRKGN